MTPAPVRPLPSVIERRKYTARVAMLLLGLAVLPAPVHANPALASYDVTKSFTADISDGKGGISAGPGKLRYLAHAFADDAHQLAQDHDSAQTGDLLLNIPLTRKLVNNGEVFGDKPAPNPDPHKWSDWVPFDQTKSLQQAQVREDASSRHLTSQATVDFEYTKPAGQSKVAKGEIVLTGAVNATDQTVHPDETAYAEAFSAGQFSLVGKITTVDGKVPLRARMENGVSSLRVLGGTGVSLDSAGVHKQQSGHIDPLSVSFLDASTGTLLVQKDLFTENWLTEGDDARIDFDPVTGLRLAVGKGSQASMSFSTLSDWVLNPFNGAISITDGVFEATGDLAAFNWVLQSVGDELQVSLSASEFDLGFDFDILAQGLGTSANDLLVAYSEDARDFASLYATIPEPSTPWLLGAAALGLWLARRKPALPGGCSSPGSRILCETWTGLDGHLLLRAIGLWQVLGAPSRRRRRLLARANSGLRHLALRGPWVCDTAARNC